MQLAMCKIGGDLDIFQALKDSGKPVTLSQLAEKTGAASGLLGEVSLMLRIVLLMIHSAHIAYTSSFRPN